MKSPHARFSPRAICHTFFLVKMSPYVCADTGSSKCFIPLLAKGYLIMEEARTFDYLTLDMLVTYIACLASKYNISWNGYQNLDYSLSRLNLTISINGMQKGASANDLHCPLHRLQSPVCCEDVGLENHVLIEGDLISVEVES